MRLCSCTQLVYLSTQTLYYDTPYHGTMAPQIIVALERLPKWYWKKQPTVNSTSPTTTTSSNTSQKSKQKEKCTTPTTTGSSIVVNYPMHRIIGVISWSRSRSEKEEWYSGSDLNSVAVVFSKRDKETRWSIQLSFPNALNNAIRPAKARPRSAK